MDLAVESYELTRRVPREEVYGMVSQIRRSAASVAANIAEGHGRDATGHYVQHLKFAQGSLKELETHLILSSRVGIASSEKVNSLMKSSDEVGRMLRSLIRSLQDGRNERTE